ncbi:MAG: L-aspartate oxidase [Dehalococcoidales bacterium]|nr:L-aspartate oxidase [Dehalococcoidales bacterium]
MKVYDYIIAGSGIAGLYTALMAKEHGSVLVITKGSIEDCNTRHAQGGIAAAIGRDDSTDLHYKDTIAAGDGLCDEETVRIMVTEAPERITGLVNLGVPFDTLDGEITLTREAAHSVPRILHAGGDATGEHIEVTLSNQIRLSGIQVLEDSLATEILVEKGKVQGIKVLDCRTGSIEQFACRFLILSTGGAGQLYKFNTNSDVATGDGLSLAYNAGAEIADMEFYQFHPTALSLPGVTPFLISEAVRGEGGILRNAEGRAFMKEYAEKGDLAPRDIVARSIVYEMEKTGTNKVYIDVTHLPIVTITTRFPNIYRFCLEHGLNINRELIPVAPAAHYMIGGIRTNIWGETNISGLFACGETACTYIHGANRLASNSLLEAVVFSKRTIEKTLNRNLSQNTTHESNQSVNYTLDRRQSIMGTAVPGLSSLQSLLWENVGILRDKDSLILAADTLATWQNVMLEPADRPSYELSNLIMAGRLVTEAALIRKESRGAHFRSDYPRRSPRWKHHIVFKQGGN